MKHLILPAGFLCLVAGVAPAAPDTGGNDPAPLRTVSHVDLERYAGTGYEIASYPQRFQKGCTATTAAYTLREDGKIQVVNRCNRDSGVLERLTGQGYDAARLQVTLQPQEPAGP